MAEQDRGSDDPRLAAIARHALHDEELIAAFAAGDIDDATDAERARSFVERCATCRDLQADLSAIRTVTQASGSAAQRAATQRAPRDFRLSAEEAARLRPSAPIERLAARLGWRARINLGIAAFGRPVGAAMATFGLVGVLIGSLSFGGTPYAEMSGTAGSPAAPGVDQSRPGGASIESFATAGPPATVKRTEAPRESLTPGGGTGGNVVLWGGSIVFVVLGLGLIVAARRARADTLAPGGN